MNHIELEIRRQREGLTYLPTRMFVTFVVRMAPSFARTKPSGSSSLIDSWLLKAHVRAKDEDNEKLRFALRLKAALNPIAVRFGDGYFNSVLVSLIRGGPFGGREPLAQVLGAIYEYEAAGGSRFDCEQLIDYEIGVAARELLSLYDNNRALAEDILMGAIAQYLDDRFHVTDRRQLGFG